MMMFLFSLSVMSDSFVTPWTVSHHAPLSPECSRQEYWNGLPFPLQGLFDDEDYFPCKSCLPFLFPRRLLDDRVRDQGG